MTRRILTAISICLPLVLGTPVQAQYPFGKNKIQYNPKDWKVIETSHYEIFYYEDEIEVAEFVASLAEDVYDEYATYFDLQFERLIPIILYGTHHDFSENNVVPYMISESTGGFTEFIKGRVALPFTGSYDHMKGVFRHEMVHVFMLEKLRVTMAGRRRFNYYHPPLWFTEGLAEFIAHGGPDTEAEMFLRDALTSEQLVDLQELWRIEGTYLMYKEGESALHYIATTYGDDAVRLILENWWKGDRFDIVLLSTIGCTSEELNDEWKEYLKRRYYPAVMTRRRIDEIGERLSSRRGWSFENHPVCVRGDDGATRVFCLGYGLGTIDLFELRLEGREHWKRKTIIRGGRNSAFESIPLMRSRLSAWGDTIAFVSKSGARDVIYLLDAGRGRVIRRVEYDSVRVINSPSLSGDGRSIVFSALDNGGKADLYVYDLVSEDVRRLTNDFYEDLNPDWHPHRDLVVFSSDRCGPEPGASMGLFTIDPGTLEISQLTGGAWRDSDPRYLPDASGILFSSDRGGAFDIYLLADDGRLIRQTNVLGGAYDPSPCPDGVSFVTAAYSGTTFHIYRVSLHRDAPVVPVEHTECRSFTWEPSLPDTGLVYTTKDYRPRFGIDLIAAAFAVDPDYGYLGNGAQIFLTDMLGDHQISLLFGSASDDLSDFFDNLNVAVTYFNQTHRLNYGFGAFHLASYIGSIYDLLRFERRYGVIGGVSYPFSKFLRIDLQTIVKTMERDDDITSIGIEEGSTNLVSNFVSLTKDNIVWGIGGPLNGHRVNIAAGRSWDLNGTRYESTTFHFDARLYFNLGSRVVVAQRYVTRNAWGSDIQLFYLGGSWDLRGYNYRQFAGKRTMLYSAELRFPLLDRLMVGLPLGNIDFPMFRGSLFFDAGKVSGFIYDTGWVGSIGAGVEMNLGYLPVMRVNFSKRTDFETIDPRTRIDFFIGFNF
jgi:hypothetical protein